MKLQQSRLGQKYQLDQSSLGRTRLGKKKLEDRIQDPQKPIASFEGENISENFSILTGQSFSKMWTFKNSGKASWPLNAVL
jgi:hypothetical protein